MKQISLLIFLLLVSMTSVNAEISQDTKKQFGNWLLLEKAASDGVSYSIINADNSNVATLYMLCISRSTSSGRYTRISYGINIAAKLPEVDDGYASIRYEINGRTHTTNISNVTLFDMKGFRKSDIVIDDLFFYESLKSANNNQHGSDSLKMSIDITQSNKGVETLLAKLTNLEWKIAGFDMASSTIISLCNK